MKHVGLALAALLLAGACSREVSTPSSQFSFALLLAGPENDGGWNQSAFEGLQKIEQKLGAKVRKITAATPTEMEQALNAAGEQGFQFVYGHGSEFNAPAAKAAAAWPGVKFATGAGPASAPNLAVVVLRNEETAYELGILAAHLTKSNVLSSLHGDKFESVERVAAGFAKGARSIKPDVKILEDYLGSWNDVALAKERALAHGSAGADVFFQNADAAGAGIFEACRQLHAFAFGCNGDQSSKAPDVIVASAVADIPELLLALAEEVRDGRFTGGTRSFGLREDRVRVVFNAALADRVPAAARTAMAAAAAAIIKGELKLASP